MADMEHRNDVQQDQEPNEGTGKKDEKKKEKVNPIVKIFTGIGRVHEKVKDTISKHPTGAEVTLLGVGAIAGGGIVRLYDFLTHDSDPEDIPEEPQEGGLLTEGEANDTSEEELETLQEDDISTDDIE